MSKWTELYNTRHKYWAGEVKVRDKWTCQHCGKVGLDRSMCAHHIKPIAECEEHERYDVSNGITLCRSCHSREHQTGSTMPQETRDKIAATNKATWAAKKQQKAA